MTNSWTRQKRLGVGDQHLVKVAKSASKLYPSMAGNGTAYHTFPGEVELTSLVELSYHSVNKVGYSRQKHFCMVWLQEPV